ncbi:MAG: citrate transporter [Lachnospiraceae bacterium]|nr:citrate transporter [Lachnospiraceae bacterium]
MEKAKTVVAVFKKDSILFISGILAVISCFFVKPDSGYIGYINFRVLAILFSLMLVVSAYIRIGTFDYFTNKLLGKIHSEKNISLFLVILSFFMSMLLTNDVTLVTLVPFALNVLKAFKDRRRTMYTLILMTVSANLGSMLTPIGNPQNLFLYTEYQITLFDFIKLMLPYSAVSFILLVISVIMLNKTDKRLDTAVTEEVAAPKLLPLLVYTVLFVLCLLTVSNIVSFLVMLGVVAAVVLVFDRKAFVNIDYGLLFTFVFFFVLIGNLGRIDLIHNALSRVIEKNVTLTAVLASQFISNVPAAMLLSAFTKKGLSLLIGTNLGGLGTLIASMASLITYKFYNKEKKEGEHYLLAFTAVNILFLVILLVLYFGLSA